MGVEIDQSGDYKPALNRVHFRTVGTIYRSPNSKNATSGECDIGREIGTA